MEDGDDRGETQTTEVTVSLDGGGRDVYLRTTSVVTAWLSGDDVNMRRPRDPSGEVVRASTPWAD